MASGQEIRISIVSALNAAGIEATKRQVDQMSKSVGASFADMAKANKTHWADIKAAWDMGVGAITKVAGFIKDAINKAFDAEYALTNFKTLLGSVDAAKEHVADLKKFASQTPLTFGDLSQASKTLLAFGVSVENVVPSLRVLGDISLGNAEKFQSLALAFGKVESQGKLTGVELKQMVLAGFNPLQEIARKTGADMGELKDQMEAGEISFELVEAAMRSATGEGGRFNNALKDASTTGHGLMSTLQDNWTMAVAAFGNAFVNSRKEGLEKMIAKLQELNQNGTIDTWAAKISAALKTVCEEAKTVVGWMSKLGDAYMWIREKGEVVGDFAGRLAGAMWEGASFSDAWNQASEHAGQTIINQERLKEEEKKLEEEIRNRAKAEKEAAEATKASTEKNEKSLEEIYAARKQVADAEKEEAEREKERAEGNKLWAEVWKEELGDATKAEAEARRNAAKATEEVKTAEERLKEAIQKYNDNIAQNMTNDIVVDSAFRSEMKGGMYNGHGDFLKKIGEIGKAASDVAVKKALSEGKIRTVADMNKIAKQADREARIASSKQAAKEGMDAKAAARIAAKGEKARSKQEQDFLDKWKQVNEANKKQKEDIQKAQQEAAAAKKRKEDAENAMIDLAGDMKLIRQKLDALGLK